MNPNIISRLNIRLALMVLSGLFLLSVVSDRLSFIRLSPSYFDQQDQVSDFSKAQNPVKGNQQPTTNHTHGHSHDHITAETAPRSKIGKMSMLYGDPAPLYERALAAHKSHSDRFGYPFYVLRSQTLPGYWSKPGYILQLLLSELTKPESERLEWLVWFDVDTVLMNPKIPLEIFLPPSNPESNWTHIHTLVTNDHRGLNNGVFFLRVHSWSVDVITATLSTPNTRPELKLDFGDQSALMYWLNQAQFRNNAMHVPQRWFNAYAGWRGPLQPAGITDTKDLFSDPLQPPTPGKEKANSIKEGDLLVHHAGHKSLRLQRMKPWMDAAEQHLPSWELELEQTGYLKEIKEFWEKEAKNERKVMDKLNKKIEADAAKKAEGKQKAEAERKAAEMAAAAAEKAKGD